MVSSETLRILLIEDDPDARLELLEELRKRADPPAGSRRPALEVSALPRGTGNRVPAREMVDQELRRFRPEIVLLDLSWSPEEDGMYQRYGLAGENGLVQSPHRVARLIGTLPGGVRFLLDHGTGPDLAVVVLTAHAYPDMVLLLRRLGAVAVLAKRHAEGLAAPVWHDRDPDERLWLEHAIDLAWRAARKRRERLEALCDVIRLEPEPGYPLGLLGTSAKFLSFVDEAERAASDGEWRVLHVLGPPGSELRETALYVVRRRSSNARSISWLKETDLGGALDRAEPPWGVELPGDFSALGWNGLAEGIRRLGERPGEFVLITGQDWERLPGDRPGVQPVLEALQAAGEWRRVTVPGFPDRHPDVVHHVRAALERVRRELFLPWLELDEDAENKLSTWSLRWSGPEALEEVLRKAARSKIEAVLERRAEAVPVGIEPFRVLPDEVPAENEYLRDRMVSDLLEMIDAGWSFKEQLDGLEDAVIRRMWKKASTSDQTRIAATLGYTLAQLRYRAKALGLIK